MLTCNGALANSNKARACEILQGCVEQETLLSILLYLDSLGCRSLHFACLFAVSRLTNLYSTAELPKCDAVITITFDIPWSGPIVRVNHPPPSFPAMAFFPARLGKHTWQSYTASPVVRTKRVVAPGRHLQHQELGIIVQRYGISARWTGRWEVRQVPADGYGNQDAPCSMCWTSRSWKPQDFARHDDVVTQAHITAIMCYT